MISLPRLTDTPAKADQHAGQGWTISLPRLTDTPAKAGRSACPG